MSGNDPFFDAWVRDKLQQVEARTPEHLWDIIRKGSRTYGITERNKYFVFVALLLITTGGIGYWAFHPTKNGHTHIMASRGPLSPAASSITAASTGSSLGTAASKIASSTIAASTTAASATAYSPAAPSAAISSPIRSDVADIQTATPPGLVSVPTLYPETNSHTMAAMRPDGSGALNGSVVSGSAVSEDSHALHLTANAEDLSLFSAGPATPTGLKPPIKEGLTPLHLLNERHTYLEFYGGPDHVTHYITASDKAYIAYVRQVKATESSYPSISIGMRIDVPLIGDDWRLKSGLHYSQINERLNYANFNDTKVVAEVSVRSVVRSAGDTVLLKDTTNLTYKGQLLKQSLNAYRRLDIPVIVSRTLLRRGPVQVNTTAGALFNVTSWYNGDILDTNLVPVALHSSARKGVQDWKSTIGASLYGSIAVYDQLTPHIQASIEPYLRDDLSPVNRSTSIYREKFLTTGLMFGIRYQLGK